MCQLGITANYSGARFIAYAVFLSVQNEDRLRLVTKQLYPDVANHFDVSVNSVERNIRTSIDIAWRRNSALLRQLARYPLVKKPSSVQFISILADYFMQRPVLRGDPLVHYNDHFNSLWPF